MTAEEPLWAAAARALKEGRLKPAERRPTIRPASTYEMDPDAEAYLFAEDES